MALAAPDPVVTPTAPPGAFARDAKGLGVGVVLGVPTGFTFAYKPALTGPWFDATVAWSFDTGALAVHGDFLYTLADLHSAEFSPFIFPVYVGFGLRLRLGQTYYAYQPSVVGFRIPMGLAFRHEGVPLEAFLEVAPGAAFFPVSRAICDIMVGARFYLPGPGG